MNELERAITTAVRYCLAVRPRETAPERSDFVIRHFRPVITGRREV